MSENTESVEWATLTPEEKKIQLFALALFGLLLWVGISSGSVLLIILDVVLLAACIAWVCFKVKKYKIRKG